MYILLIYVAVKNEDNSDRLMRAAFFPLMLVVLFKPGPLVEYDQQNLNRDNIEEKEKDQ